MTTDRELLELAAKAAGYETNHPMNTERLALDPPVDALWISNSGGLVHTGWNPLTDDGDALRLAVKLNLQVIPGTYKKDEVMVYSAGIVEVSEYVHYLQDIYVATRRAIVRAAAVIGAKS